MCIRDIFAVAVQRAKAQPGRLIGTKEGDSTMVCRSVKRSMRALGSTFVIALCLAGTTAQALGRQANDPAVSESDISMRREGQGPFKRIVLRLSLIHI